MVNFKRYWEQLERKNKPPKFLNEINEISLSEWKKTIDDTLRSKVLIDQLHNGTFLLVKNAINKKFLIDLRTQLTRIENKTAPSFYKMLEGCPNFHKNIDDKIDKKYSIKSTRHSFYFFRWNEDTLNLFNKFDQIWSDIKYLSGYKREAFINNTPKDGIVDRLQIVRYPAKTGYIEPHQHNTNHQRLIISIYMSKKGEDYKTG